MANSVLLTSSYIVLSQALGYHIVLARSTDLSLLLYMSDAIDQFLYTCPQDQTSSCARKHIRLNCKENYSRVAFWGVMNPID